MVNKGGTDMWTRELLKRNAKEIFKRNYWTCVGVSLVLAALTGGGSSVIGRIGGNNTSVSYHHYEVIITMEILPEVL